MKDQSNFSNRVFALHNNRMRKFPYPSCTYEAVAFEDRLFTYYLISYWCSILVEQKHVIHVGEQSARSHSIKLLYVLYTVLKPKYVISTFVSFGDCKLITVLSRKWSSLNCFSQVELQRATVMTIRKHCFFHFNRDQAVDLRE